MPVLRTGAPLNIPLAHAAMVAVEGMPPQQMVLRKMRMQSHTNAMPNIPTFGKHHTKDKSTL
jgi:hypothetical protein